jgi:hypothetical protein
VQALRAVGAQVWKLNDADLPDLLVMYRGKQYLPEVKTGNAKRRPGQLKFAECAEAAGCKAPLLRTVEDALEMIGKG